MFGISALGFLTRIPRWVWIALAGAAIMAGLVVWHGNVAGSAITAAHDRGVAEGRARWEREIAAAHAEAQRWRHQAESRHDAVSQTVRTSNDQEASRTHAAAGALRVSGPGAAACPRPLDHPALAGPAGGREPPARPADDAGPGVPAQDRAAVPWTWLVDRAEQCDLNRAEADAWRTADAEHRRLNETERAAGADSQ